MPAPRGGCATVINVANVRFMSRALLQGWRLTTRTGYRNVWTGTLAVVQQVQVAMRCLSPLTLPVSTSTSSGGIAFTGSGLTSGILPSATGTVTTSGSGSSGGGVGAVNGGISVSLVKESSVQQAGIITVSVPKKMATAGSGFSFPLPSQVTDPTGNRALIQVTTATGESLPSWLSFNQETKTFFAAAIPDGAFPMQVIVIVGSVRTIIVISERTEQTP